MRLVCVSEGKLDPHAADLLLCRRKGESGSEDTGREFDLVSEGGLVHNPPGVSLVGRESVQGRLSLGGV
jgi:hypothetical protein